MPTLADTVQLGIFWTLDLLAILSNIILIAAIRLRTPKRLQSYSVFLLNNAIVDLSTAIASAMGSVRVVENHTAGSSIFVFLGPCSTISEHLCRMCHALHVNLVPHSMIILLLSFAYRLYILGDVFGSRSPPSREQLWMICLLSLLLIVPHTAGYYLQQKTVTDEVLDHYHLEGYTAASFDLFSPQALGLNAIACTIAPLVMTMNFLVRRKLMMQIDQFKTIDKRHHESIAKALTYQMMLPIGAAIAVSFWMLDVAQIFSSEIAERLIMVMFSVFSLASPLINLTMLPPYRAMLNRFLTRKQSEHSVSQVNPTIKKVSSSQIIPTIKH